ncbi:YjiH family protein [Rossellomorea sp. FS2]|uniref:YjiH family protein n=1 Tax=Rossellomorea sp. FS2 TaxID=3391447 RepID=UPI003A4DB5A5
MNPQQRFTLGQQLRFIIPSLLGILLFIVPLPVDGEVTIPIAVLSNALLDAIGPVIPYVMTILIALTIIGTFITKAFKPAVIMDSPFFKTLFNVTPVWFVIRIVGGIYAVMTLFKLGPEWIWSEDTGGLLLSSDGLISILFCVFLFAGLLLPLLLNFGLLEFFGSILTKVMRPIFNLPGRSSIDCLASWLGDGTIGVLLTSKQYEEGFYTKREAAVIGTTFSVVSITFCLVVISTVNLSEFFFPFYLTVTFSGLVAAIILPRIPPLSRKPDTYFNDQEGKDTAETIPDGYTRAGYGYEQAVLQAKKNNSVSKFITDGMKNVLDMWMGVAPIVMAIGTTALIVAENTKFFEWIGIPFIPVLDLLQIPEAAEASKTILVGFADMFLPTIFGAGIESDMTRFIIACLSVTQLIYLSEVGGLLLGSKIPVSFWDLVVIFLQRTILTLLIIVGIAHLLF